MEWISVKDKLPDNAGRYLVCVLWAYGKHITIADWTLKYDGLTEHLQGKAVWYGYDGEWDDFEMIGVTHWMPLPEVPED